MSWKPKPDPPPDLKPPSRGSGRGVNWLLVVILGGAALVWVLFGAAICRAGGG